MSRLVTGNPFFGLQMLNDSLDQRAQMKRQLQLDQERQQQNALAQQFQQMQLAQAQEQQAMQGRTRNALASAVQPYGPFREGMYTPENPRPMGMEDIGRRVIQGGGDPFVGMGYIEKGMPAKPEYQIIDGQYVPKQPGGPATPIPGFKPAEKTPLVNVGVNMPKQEEEFRKGMGKFYAEEFSGMQKEGREAHTNTARLSRAKSLVTNINTGKLKPAANVVKSIVKDLGYDLGSYGLTDDVGMAEALKAVSIDLTMDTVQRTKGAVSNKEMELFAQVAPQLSNTTEGNLLIIEMADRLNKNKVQVAQLAREYLRKNGRYDEGFYDELDKFYEKNPLFTEDIYRQVEKLTGASNEAKGRGIVGPQPVDYSGVQDDDLLRILGVTK